MSWKSLVLLLASLPPARAKCRRMSRAEQPLQKCVLYRHKEELPLDAAPFFDVYADGQMPDTFAELWLGDRLPFRAPLMEVGYARENLTLAHQICLAAAADTCDFLRPLEPRPAREYAPDAGAGQSGSAVYDERGGIYTSHPPFTTWQDEHPEGFWSDGRDGGTPQSDSAMTSSMGAEFVDPKALAEGDVRVEPPYDTTPSARTQGEYWPAT